MTSFLHRIRGRPPRLILLALVCAGGLVLALRLDGSASIGSFYDRATPAGRATDSFHRQFGEEPVQVLVKGSPAQGGLPALLLTEDLARMLGLEGCLSGNLPRGARAPAPACAELARTKPVYVVYGPGTFINESAREVRSRLGAQRASAVAKAERAAEAARKVAAAQGRSAAEQAQLGRQARTLSLAQSYQDTLGLALRYGLSRMPQLNDPGFVSKLVFEPSLGFDTPKPRFAYLFPSNETALIQARLRPGLSDSQRRHAISLVRQAAASPTFRLKRGSYLVSGDPVASEAVASSVKDSLWLPLIAAVILAAAALLVLSTLRRRLLRLWPLVPALAAIALALGVLSLLGGSLTLACVAVPPLLVGFACTLALLSERTRPSAGSRPLALVALASAIGFLALGASPVPMVRSFGAVVALGLAAFLALAAFTRARGGSAGATGASGRRLGGERRFTGAARRAARSSLDAATRRPGRVLAAAAIVALAGWIASSHTGAATTLERLAPGGVSEVKDDKQLRRETGFSGDLAVLIRSDHITAPALFRWMAGYQQRVLARHGYSDQRECRSADICPGLALTSLVGNGPSARQVQAALRQLPISLARSVISRDGKTTVMTFAVRSMPLADQEKLVSDMRSQLDPPPGVHAELAGLPALAADTGAALETNWAALALVVLATMFLALLTSGSSGRPALATLAPPALASGWAGFLLFALPIPLDPMSGALVAVLVGLAAAFSVVVAGRYREQRSAGIATRDALASAYADGAALAAVAVPAMAGLGVLTISDVPMLRHLGIAALVEVPIVLAATALVLPAALVWEERRGRLRAPTRAEALALARAMAKGTRTAAVAGGRGMRALPAALRRSAASARRRVAARRRDRDTRAPRRGIRRRGETQRP